MKTLSIKEVILVIIIILADYILTGCATSNRPGTEPPQRFKKDLDHLKSDRNTGKSTIYTIKKGDTIWRIAYKHGVNPDKIIKINHIKDVTDIKPGQKLIIPAGIANIEKTLGMVNPIPTKRPNESFIWPLQGRKLTSFGQWIDGEKNTGIDIQATYGQHVKASKSGLVALVSDRPDGWGKVVILQHNDNSYTWYAHNSEIFVKKGDTVTQSQIIAKAGSTGKAEQDKLHFKIFLHGVPVDPLHLLR